MIRINLLPPEMRKAAGLQKISVPWRSLGIGALVVWVTASALLGLTVVWQGRTLARLHAEWNQLEPEKTQLESVRQAVQALQQRNEIITLTKGPEGKWAPRLNLLSDAAVPQLWFTSLKWTRGQTLLLEGAALQEAVAPSDQSTAVGQFLEHLKSHPQFPKWFRSVELQSVEHGQVAGEEIVRFSIRLDPSR